MARCKNALAWQIAAMSKTARPDSYSAVQRDIGRRITWARELVGWNINEAAEILGIHRSTLSKIEKGERAASIFNVISLANRLRVSTDYLLRGLLTARTDEEMAHLLVKYHPELVPTPRHMAKDMGMDPGGDTPH